MSAGNGEQIEPNKLKLQLLRTKLTSHSNLEDRGGFKYEKPTALDTIKLERGFNGLNQTLNVEQELDKKSTELRLIYNSLREIVTNWFAWGAKSIFYAAKHALVKHPASQPVTAQ